MSFLFAVAAIANGLVGALIGISGIAGFLLPITLNGFLGMNMADALALSFASFLTSGILGAWAYHKKGNLDLWLSIPLCIGSLAGALLGVRLNLVLPVATAKTLLYAVVLLSGISVLLKKDKASEDDKGNKISAPVLVILGVVTAAICALTGAGGPVLVVPLLAMLGVNLRVAVGVSLLDSVAIALPACAGYFAGATLEPGTLALLTAICVVFHGAGVLFGARVSGKVNLKVLRLMVGLLAVTAACYMLVKLFFFS